MEPQNIFIQWQTCIAAKFRARRRASIGWSRGPRVKELPDLDPGARSYQSFCPETTVDKFYNDK